MMMKTQVTGAESSSPGRHAGETALHPCTKRISHVEHVVLMTTWSSHHTIHPSSPHICLISHAWAHGTPITTHPIMRNSPHKSVFSASVGWVRDTTLSLISSHQFVSLTIDVRSQGGVGKSSLVNHVFRAKEAVRCHSQRCEMCATDRVGS